MAWELLEINLISAQNLERSAHSAARRLHTYAVAWVDPATKLRTRIDRVGRENPTWNDKFIFRVPAGFLSSDSSAISIEIYALGLLRDALVGTVRFLVGSSTAAAVPAFSALQIRRPSGRCQGILNVGAVVLAGPLHPSLFGSSAVGYQDLMGQGLRLARPPRIPSRADSLEGSSKENRAENGGDVSEVEMIRRSGSGVLREWNNPIRDRSIFDWLGFQKKIHISRSAPNLQLGSASGEIEGSS